MRVADFMTIDVISVHPDDSLIKAAQLLFDHNFDGLPVLDNEGTVVGLITQYDLVSKGANIHLPTFLRLMKQFPLYSRDKTIIKPELEKIVSLRVCDLMNTEPLIVPPEESMENVAKFFSEHHGVNPIPVIDPRNRLVGIISRYDIIKLYTGSMDSAVAIQRLHSVDKKVEIFLKEFEKNFVMVSRFRTRFWVIASILFAVVGFAIAMFLLIRFELKN